jgi:anti-sigma B factor antagonist
MAGPPTPFGIHESRVGESMLLRLTGELDLASAPTLEYRLEALRNQGRSVRLDLSRLEFIDSTGIHVLVRAFSSTNTNGWAFQIDPDISPPVMRVLEIVNLDHLVPVGDPAKSPHPVPEPAA